MFLLYHAYVYLEFLILACTIYILAPRICFTIKERSILREEASSTAARIRYLPYDTPLEIISDIPRWYQVTYTDENGAEITGWISKISVELEG